MWGDGLGFVPDELIPNATTLVLGQAPGSQEEREGKPFVGPTGQLQTEHFFPLAQLERGKNVSIANVLKCRWVEHGKKTDKLPPDNILYPAIEHCTTNHLRIPSIVTNVIAEGAIAASWCAGRPTTIHRWRGHVLYPLRRELSNTDEVSANDGKTARNILGSQETVQRKTPKLPERIPNEIQIKEQGTNSERQTRTVFTKQGEEEVVLERIPTYSQEGTPLQLNLGTSSNDVQRTEQSMRSLQAGVEVSNRPQSHNYESSGPTLQPLQQVGRVVRGVNTNIGSCNQIYTGRGLTVFVLEHLASVLRDPRSFWITELDWRKFPRIGQQWPYPIPSRLIATPDNWNAILEWFKSAIRSAPYIAIDTEFIGRPFGVAQPLLTIIGLGWCDTRGTVHGLQLDCRTAENWMRASFYHHLAELVRLVPVLFQNFAADMPVLKRCAGIQYDTYKQIDDQMLAHAIIYCELPHDLEFLTSIYGQYYKIKHLGDNDIPEAEKWESLRWLIHKGWLTTIDSDTPDLLYNWGDVLEPLMIWEHLKKAFEMDHAAYNVYKTQSVALIPILLRSMERGIKVNKPRVMAAKIEYEARVRQAQVLAEAYYGKPINLGSDDQVAYYCYCERDYPIQYHRKTKNPTVDEDAIAILRDYVGPDVNTQIPLTLELALHRIEQGADPILEARVLYQDAQHALDSYIYGLVESVYTEYDETRKKAARKRIKKEGFTKEDIVDRVYPNFAIHTQKNARWSTTNPPLAQLPSDLRDIIIPDDGECWPHWDWKGMELHFLELHSGSRILKEAHDNGIDLHTWTMCKMFGYQLPPNLKAPFTAPENETWRARYNLRSSGDPRRVFSKSARFEMNYGGAGNTAAQKAIRMGLSKHEVQQALANLLTADVDYYKWRQVIERQVKATRIIRTFTGRPRRFLTISKDHGTSVPPKVVREALDYPMQAGVSDFGNLTIVLLAEKFPFIGFSWQMHDAQYWIISQHLCTPTFMQDIKDIVEREISICGRLKRFPADFDIIYPPTGIK